MTAHIEHEGKPISIRGYAVVWNSISHPHPMWGNRPGLFLPSAFDGVLKSPTLSLNCRAYHLDHAVMGSLREKNLEMWKDDFGLAFCVGPMPVAVGIASTIRAIVAGETRGVSTSIEAAETETRLVDGEGVVAVRRIKALRHFSPVATPSDPATAVWCSHEPWEKLTPRLRVLADAWETNRPRHDPAAALTYLRERVVSIPRKVTARAALPARAAAARSNGRAAATKPIVIGLTDEEWRDFGATEAVNRRTSRDAQAGQYALQRERNRWRRKRGAA